MKKIRLNKRAFEMATETVDGTYSLYPFSGKDIARCVLESYLRQLQFIEEEKANRKRASKKDV